MPSKKLLELRNTIASKDYNYLVAVDPSCRRAGYAVFAHCSKLIESGNMIGDSEKIINEFIKICKTVNGIVLFVFEKPEFYGPTSLGAQTGSVIPLARIEGILLGAAKSFGDVFELTPREWKGQLPKKITTKKVNEICNMILKSTGKNSDEADAIVIGLRVLGEF